MKKIILAAAALLMAGHNIFALLPTFFGARSLSLGYSSLAYNYDVNNIFINPAALASLPRSLSGYQFQYSYMDHIDFKDRLDEVLNYNLKNIASMTLDEKQVLFDQLNTLFSSKFGLHGFRANIPGLVSKEYGFAVSFVNTAVVNPIESDFFSKSYEDITNEDIASLHMNFLGLRYTQFSLSYGMNISRGMSLGISLHYMYGKITEFSSSITDDIFDSDNSTEQYLEHAWDDADQTFYKLNVDLSLSVDIGKYFKCALLMRNVGNPTLVTSQRNIVLERRLTAGLAFRPTLQWGIYLDMDLTKTDLFLNGEEVQLISLGVEKGFFQNKFFLRAGFLSDLTENYFLGGRSNSLYGLGFGFNMSKILVDFAMGINSGGAVNNIAISGFFMFN